MRQPQRQRLKAHHHEFQPDKSDTLTITGYGPGWVAVDKQRYDHSLVVSSLGTVQPWNCARFADLGPAHFARLVDFGVETIIFGSGSLALPAPRHGLRR